MNFLRKILKNKEILFFATVLLFGSFLRLYRLPETMQFLGDQGRDALIARGILIDHDPAFIGPVTSVGNMYLGPFYYYFMVLPLMFTYPSPVGPAYAVAFLGIVTLGLMYVFGRQMIGKLGAGIATFLYALSPVVIENVRFSWNPNIVPLCSLIAVWAVWKTQRRQYRYWIIVGICCALLFQLHYISLILIGCFGLVWIWQLWSQLKDRKVDAVFVRATMWAVVLFLISLTPLLIFDTKHDWLNTRAFIQFFHPSVSSESHFRPLRDVSGVIVALLSMSARMVGQFFAIAATTLSQKILIVLFFFYALVRALSLKEKQERKSAMLLMTVLFIFSVVFLSLYSSSVFNHYLGFTFPIVFLIFGFVLASLWRSIALKPLCILIIAIVSVVSIRHYPGTLQLGSTVYLFQRSSEAIARHVPDDTTFNLLSYSPTKDLQAMNYRYFLTALGKTPAQPDDWTSFSRLYIIDEEHRINPLDEEQYVIKIWPNRTIVDHFSIPDGPDVYVVER